MSKPLAFYVTLSNFGGTLAVEGADNLTQAQRYAMEFASVMEPGDIIKIVESEEQDITNFNYVGSPEHY